MALANIRHSHLQANRGIHLQVSIMLSLSFKSRFSVSIKKKKWDFWSQEMWEAEKSIFPTGKTSDSWFPLENIRNLKSRGNQGTWNLERDRRLQGEVSSKHSLPGDQWCQMAYKLTESREWIQSPFQNHQRVEKVHDAKVSKILYTRQQNDPWKMRKWGNSTI